MIPLRVLLRVKKFDPESDARPHWRDYTVEAAREMTLLSALLKIKSEVDGTLTFRASCRAAICGSCLMQVNGVQKLACRVSLRDEMARHGRIDVGPAANLPVIRDLVVVMTPFWEKIRAVTPYVVSDPPPAALPATPAASTMPTAPVTLSGLHERLHNADGCIMCGACLSACQSAEVSPDFLGPAALAKAYRFQADPRDTTHHDRLVALQGAGGIWDCVRCNFCVAVCPKDVAPMEQIIRLRRLSLSGGLTAEIGARHITQFVGVVAEEGRLNETQLPLRMIWGDWRAMLRLLPLAWNLLRHGKMPLPLHRWPGREEIRSIFRRVGKTTPHPQN